MRPSKYFNRISLTVFDEATLTEQMVLKPPIPDFENREAFSIPTA
jgi:hypothetical protein